MNSESDDLIFYTEDGDNCVKGYFKVLTEPEEINDSSWTWIARMNVAGKEVGELRAQFYLATADDDARRIFGTLMGCRAGDRVYLEGFIWEKTFLIVDDIASDNPYDTATREYPADPEYWRVYPKPIPPQKGFWISGTDRHEFDREINEKGYRFVRRRLRKEGLESDLAFFYKPPGHSRPDN